jgi:hypothetical protein
MSEWERSTRECSFADLAAADAIRAYAEERGLGDLEHDALIVCETTSKRTKKGLLRRAKTQQTGIVVTPRFLVWAASDEGEPAAVVAAKLDEIEIKEFRSDLVEDSGLEVFGFLYGSSERAQAFIGLGSESAAQRLREVLGKATVRT